LDRQSVDGKRADGRPKIPLSDREARDGGEICCHNPFHRHQGEIAMLSLLINVLIIVVVGALCFYLIDKFVRDGRLANLLKILVALICILAVLRHLLPALGLSGLL
jgi:hypothetical protein